MIDDCLPTCTCRYIPQYFHLQNVDSAFIVPYTGEVLICMLHRNLGKPTEGDRKLLADMKIMVNYCTRKGCS